MIPGAQKGQTKVVAAKVAEELSGVRFLKSERSKVSHDGIVDAYLIAFYALQIERDV